MHSQQRPYIVQQLVSQHNILSVGVKVEYNFGGAYVEGNMHAGDVVAYALPVVLHTELFQIHLLESLVLHLLLLSYVLLPHLFGHLTDIRILHILNEALGIWLS